MVLASGLYEMNGERLSRQTLAAMVVRGEVAPETVVTDPAGNRARAGDAVSAPEIRELFNEAVRDYAEGFLSDAERSLDIISRLTRGLAVAPETSLYLGVIAYRRGFLRQAQAFLTRLLDTNEVGLKCIAMNNLGVVASVEGRFDDAKRWLVESVGLAIRARIPNPVFNLDFLARRLLGTSLASLLGSDESPETPAQPEEESGRAKAPSAGEQEARQDDQSVSVMPSCAMERQTILDWAAAMSDRYEPLCLMLREEISTAALDEKRVRQRLSVEEEVGLATTYAGKEEWRNAWHTIKPVLQGPPDLVSDDVRQTAEQIRTAWALSIIGELQQALVDGDFDKAKVLLVELKECDESLHERWVRHVDAAEYTAKVKEALRLMCCPVTLAEGLVRLREALATYSEAGWDITPEQCGDLFLGAPDCQKLLIETLEQWSLGNISDAQEKVEELIELVQSRGWLAEDAKRLWEVLSEQIARALASLAEVEGQKRAGNERLDRIAEAIEKAQGLYASAREAFDAGQTAEGLRLLKQAIDARGEVPLPTDDWERELEDRIRKALVRVEDELLPAGDIEQSSGILDALEGIGAEHVDATKLGELRRDVEERRRLVSLPGEVRNALAEAANAFRAGRPARAYDLLRALPPHYCQEEIVAKAMAQYREAMSWWQRFVRGV